MILAAAAHAEDPKHPPPRELRLAWQMQGWGALPNAGGLRDQRAGELERASTALNVYRAFKDWRAADNWQEFQENHPEQWRIVGQVRKLRRAING